MDYCIYETMYVSDCCGAPIMYGDICSRCKEHCDSVIEDEDEDEDE